MSDQNGAHFGYTGRRDNSPMYPSYTPGNWMNKLVVNETNVDDDSSTISTFAPRNRKRRRNSRRTCVTTSLVGSALVLILLGVSLVPLILYLIEKDQYKYYKADASITFQGIYNKSLGDLSTNTSKDFQQDFCEVMEQTQASKFKDTYSGCLVTQIKNGSITVTFNMYYYAKVTVKSDDVKTEITIYLKAKVGQVAFPSTFNITAVANSLTVSLQQTGEDEYQSAFKDIRFKPSLLASSPESTTSILVTTMNINSDNVTTTTVQPETTFTDPSDTTYTNPESTTALVPPETSATNPPDTTTLVQAVTTATNPPTTKTTFPPVITTTISPVITTTVPPDTSTYTNSPATTTAVPPDTITTNSPATTTTVPPVTTTTNSLITTTVPPDTTTTDSPATTTTVPPDTTTITKSLDITTTVPSVTTTKNVPPTTAMPPDTTTKNSPTTTTAVSPDTITADSDGITILVTTSQVYPDNTTTNLPSTTTPVPLDTNTTNLPSSTTTNLTEIITKISPTTITTLPETTITNTLASTTTVFSETTSTNTPASPTSATTVSTDTTITTTYNASTSATTIFPDTDTTISPNTTEIISDTTIPQFSTTSTFVTTTTVNYTTTAATTTSQDPFAVVVMENSVGEIGKQAYMPCTIDIKSGNWTMIYIYQTNNDSIEPKIATISKDGTETVFTNDPLLVPTFHVSGSQIEAAVSFNFSNFDSSQCSMRDYRFTCSIEMTNGNTFNASADFNLIAPLTEPSVALHGTRYMFNETANVSLAAIDATCNTTRDSDITYTIAMRIQNASGDISSFVDVTSYNMSTDTCGEFVFIHWIEVFPYRSDLNGSNLTCYVQGNSKTISSEIITLTFLEQQNPTVSSIVNSASTTSTNTETMMTSLQDSTTTDLLYTNNNTHPITTITASQDTTNGTLSTSKATETSSDTSTVTSFDTTSSNTIIMTSTEISTTTTQVLSQPFAVIEMENSVGEIGKQAYMTCTIEIKSGDWTMIYIYQTHNDSIEPKIATISKDGTETVFTSDALLVPTFHVSGSQIVAAVSFNFSNFDSSKCSMRDYRFTCSVEMTNGNTFNASADFNLIAPLTQPSVALIKTMYVFDPTENRFLAGINATCNATRDRSSDISSTIAMQIQNVSGLDITSYANVTSYNVSTKECGEFVFIRWSEVMPYTSDMNGSSLTCYVEASGRTVISENITLTFLEQMPP